ncbi:MAG TPA: RDD family protein [Gemmataceae bacterium]|nr:RDD family protein [Gemmataceae bacterium]
MAWADDHKIETPELVEVSLEIAGLGSRFVAQIYDWYVKWGILLLVSLLAAVVLALLGSFDALRSGSVLILALVVALFYFFLLGFDIYYEVRRNGQTPGKRLAGIRVIREGGGPLDFQSACIRNLLGLADFLPAFYLLGGLLVLLSPRGQRLGDMAAGTIVVRERALQPPVDLEVLVDEESSTEMVFTPEQLAACSPGDRHILRSFLQRYPDMEPEARGVLAERLADTFQNKIHYEPTDFIEPEVFLTSLYRDLENWARHGH